MTSTQHAQWLVSGGHWRPAVPITQMTRAIRIAYPFAEIGTIGDDSHLDAEPPEDHTPYSETGWPVPTPYGVVTAFDVSNIPHLDVVAIYWVNEARGGRAPWIKYINFNGMQWSHTDGFQSPHQNSDYGHVHVSIRSDWCDRSIGSWPVLPSVTTTPDPNSTPRSEIEVKVRNIAQGANGWDVASVQAALQAHGFPVGPTGIDGDCGPNTVHAIRAFQEAHGLSVDGEAGPHTQSVLFTGHDL